MEGKRWQPIALYAWSFIIVLCLGGAASAESYPFDDTGYLGEAALMTVWRETLARQRQDSADLSDCIADRDTCRDVHQGLSHLLDRAGSLSESRQISIVNHYVNRKRYRIDRARRISTDPDSEPLKYRSRWATVTEFIERGGDCEDYATTKYFLLRELGIPADRLRIVIAYDHGARSHHAVLAIRTVEDEVLLLDTDSIIRRGHRHDYRFIYSLNELSIWDHEAPEQGAAVSGIGPASGTPNPILKEERSS